MNPRRMSSTGVSSHCWKMWLFPVGSGDQCDRAAEARRYDRAAQSLGNPREALNGLQDTDSYLGLPYGKFVRCCEDLIGSHSRVLEIGAGTGRFTGFPAVKGCVTVPVDISYESSRFNRARHDAGLRVFPVVCDIARLPLRTASLDLVMSAGALSYADPNSLDPELLRVLAPGGALVVVDSINHNPAFRFNRYLHYLRGHRTKSTLRRMPTIGRLLALGANFAHSEITFFGGLSMLYPLTRIVLGERRATIILARIDAALPSRLAFKAVLVATGYLHSDGNCDADARAS